MRVLIGIEDMASSKDAVRVLTTQFRSEATQVLALHVIEPASPVPPPEMSADYTPELDGQKHPAAAMLERVADRLRGAGFCVETSVQVGEVRDALIENAAAWHADLILVGSHGRRGIDRFLLGSVAESVARRALCSVEIVRIAAEAA